MSVLFLDAVICQSMDALYIQDIKSDISACLSIKLFSPSSSSGLTAEQLLRQRKLRQQQKQREFREQLLRKQQQQQQQQPQTGVEKAGEPQELGGHQQGTANGVPSPEEGQSHTLLCHLSNMHWTSVCIKSS